MILHLPFLKKKIKKLLCYPTNKVKDRENQKQNKKRKRKRNYAHSNLPHIHKNLYYCIHQYPQNAFHQQKNHNAIPYRKHANPLIRLPTLIIIFFVSICIRIRYIGIRERTPWCATLSPLDHSLISMALYFFTRHHCAKNS